MGANDETNIDDEIDTSDTDDDTTDDDATEDESDTSQNSDDDDESDDSEDGEGGDKGNSDDESDNDDDDADEDDGAEPEIRKPKAGAPNSEWAAYRKQQKEKKAAAEKSGADDNDIDDAEDSDDDDDDLSPEDKAALDKRIEKKLAPFKKQALEQEVDAEIATFLSKNPDFKPFAAKTRRWALHPNRSGVPVKSIFYEVAGDKLMAIGAKRAKAADQKANQTKNHGQNAGDKGSKSYKDMPLKDFGQELEAAKLRR